MGTVTPVDGLAKVRAVVEAAQQLEDQAVDLCNRLDLGMDAKAIEDGKTWVRLAGEKNAAAIKALSQPPTDAEVEALAEWMWEVDITRMNKGKDAAWMTWPERCAEPARWRVVARALLTALEGGINNEKGA